MWERLTPSGVVVIVILLLFIPMLFHSHLISVMGETPGDFQYELINDGTEVEITEYEGGGGNVKIPATIEGRPVTSIRDYSFNTVKSIISIAIPGSVTNIGLWAFRDCTSLMSINVDASNPFFSSIDGLLYSKDGSTLVKCPPAVVGKITIPSGTSTLAQFAFTFCLSLNEVSLPNTLKVIEMGALSSCPLLTNIDIPNGVEKIGFGAFWSDSALVSITFPSSLMTIDDRPFTGCFHLKKIVFEGNAPEGVTLWDFPWGT